MSAGNILFFSALVVAMAIGLLYFRDLGDISQMIVKVKRENTLRFIRNEYLFLAIGSLAIVAFIIAYADMDGGSSWVFWPALVLMAFLYIFPWVWVHLGLRNQAGTAAFCSPAEALQYLAPASPVVVIENNGVARAHPDSQLMHPHLAGNEAGLDGENVIMTYCAMANLGLGYIPEVQGRACALEVLAQHGNNLIMRDNNTREPIQQIYGFPDGDPDREGMQQWPTFRMTLRSFAKAYPDGEVFLNSPPKNPLLWLLDMATGISFGWGISRQHNEAKPIMDNMTREDDRLPAKTYVWGIDIGEDAVCFTEEFLVDNDNLINTEVGGRKIVLALHPRYESLGAWHNTGNSPVSEIDFFGNSDQGKLQRVERLKAGLFWHVWAEFFPQTDINRTASAQEEAADAA